MSQEPDQLGVALLVGDALEQVGCTWMIGGSIATSAYGEPRATHDVDLVANLVLVQVAPFVRALGSGFYADEDVIREAVARKASFNVIHYDTTEKVDVFRLRPEAFAVDGLKNRIQLDLGDGRVAPVAQPGHMVVEKLRWYRRGGEVSDRQRLPTLPYRCCRSAALRSTSRHFAAGLTRWECGICSSEH